MSWNWSHLKTILWLRWRLSRNQLRRGGAWNAFFTWLFAGGTVLLALVGGGAGLFLGSTQLKGLSSVRLLIFWDIFALVFLFLWLLGVLMELQRAEAIDLQRLLHLPVSLKEIFVFNYLASHVNLVLILAAPFALGAAVGTAIANGPEFVLLIGLVLSFFFMITAWTYYVRGWLVSLMANPRRRRAILVGLTVGFVLVAQLPNLYMNLFHRNQRQHRPGPAPTRVEAERSGEAARARERMLESLVRTHRYIPPLWLALGASELQSGRVLPALGGVLAATALGWAGLQLGFRSTLRFYQGASSARGAVKPAKARARPKPNWVERGILGLPEEAAAVAWATLRSMSRAPEVKLALVSSLVMLIVFIPMTFGRRSLPVIATPLVATGGVFLLFFGLLQLALNQFGFDRDAFRSLVLSPASRKWILLGKNAALFVLATILGVLLLGMLLLMRKIPFVDFAAGLVQIISLTIVVCLAGNLISVALPYRIEPGSMKPTKTSAQTGLLLFVCHLVFPFAALPVAVPPGLAVLFAYTGIGGAAWVNLGGTVLLLLLLAALYVWALPRLGDYLEEREMEVLRRVTAGTE